MKQARKKRLLDALPPALAVGVRQVRNAGKFLWDGMKKQVDEAFGFPEDCGGAALVRQLNTSGDKT